MKISVALCTYNGARFIREQLESIAAQTRVPDEVIICDDCSTDETPQLIAQFSPKAPFKLSFSKNEAQLGVAKNFEHAISKCSGDVIFLCDQDDYWLPEKVSVMLHHFEADERVGLVFSDAAVTDSALKRLGYTMWKTVELNKKRQAQLNGDEAPSVLIRRYVVTGAASAFRSDLRKHIVPIPSISFHDAWIACVASSLYRIVAINAPLILYRQHDANVIGGRQIGFFSRVNRAVSISPNWFDLEARRAIELLQRFQAIDASRIDEKYLNDLKEKIVHFECRRDLFFEGFFQRMALVMREVFFLRYFKFSRGLGAAFIDLFFREKMERKPTSDS